MLVAHMPIPKSNLIDSIFSLLKKNNGKFKSEKQSDFLITQLKMHTGFLGYVNNGKIKNPIFVEYDKYGITKLLKKLTGSNMIEIIFERNAQSELHPKDVIMLKKIESILIEQQPKETITNKKQYRLSTYELAKNVYSLAKNNNGLFKSEVQGNFLIEQLNLSDGYLGQTNGIKYKNPIFAEYNKEGITKIYKQMAASTKVEIIFERKVEGELTSLEVKALASYKRKLKKLEKELKERMTSFLTGDYNSSGDPSTYTEDIIEMYNRHNDVKIKAIEHIKSEIAKLEK
jgi:hypothetical protein